MDSCTAPNPGSSSSKSVDYFLAQPVFHDLGSNESTSQPNSGKDDLQSYVSAFGSIMEARVAVIRPSDAMMEHITQMVSDLPAASSVGLDAARIEHTFGISIHNKGGKGMKKSAGESLLQKARAASYRAELTKICQHLDTGGPFEDLPGDTPIQQQYELDVKSELEGAWIQDRATILTVQNTILNEVCPSIRLRHIHC